MRFEIQVSRLIERLPLLCFQIPCFEQGNEKTLVFIPTGENTVLGEAKRSFLNDRCVSVSRNEVCTSTSPSTVSSIWSQAARRNKPNTQTMKQQPDSYTMQHTRLPAPSQSLRPQHRPSTTIAQALSHQPICTQATTYHSRVQTPASADGS